MSIKNDLSSALDIVFFDQTNNNDFNSLKLNEKYKEKSLGKFCNKKLKFYLLNPEYFPTVCTDCKHGYPKFKNYYTIKTNSTMNDEVFGQYIEKGWLANDIKDKNVHLKDFFYGSGKSFELSFVQRKLEISYLLGIFKNMYQNSYPLFFKIFNHIFPEVF